MGYERYPGWSNQSGESDGGRDPSDFGRDYGSGRAYTYSSARDYEAAGAYRRDDERGGYYGGERGGRYGARSYGRDDGYPGNGFRTDGQRGDRGGNYGGGSPYHGSYAHDGRRFLDVGNRRDWDDDNRRSAPPRGRAPQGYDYDDRGFFARAGDEVRSWFGDEDAERRREWDSRVDERNYAGGGRDDDYHSWRSGQIAALDRDYDEYRRENRSRFENEFSTWRTGRQSQRDLLNKVEEHAEVLGSDGAHVGTVDKVRGDRILLTKNDADAGGQHHSVPSSWLQSVEADKVTLNKTTDEAKRQWRDEDRSQAMFGYGDNNKADRTDTASGEQGRDSDGRMLNRSFRGTY